MCRPISYLVVVLTENLTTTAAGRAQILCAGFTSKKFYKAAISLISARRVHEYRGTVDVCIEGHDNE